MTIESEKVFFWLLEEYKEAVVRSRVGMELDQRLQDLRSFFHRFRHLKLYNRMSDDLYAELLWVLWRTRSRVKRRKIIGAALEKLRIKK